MTPREYYDVVKSQKLREFHKLQEECKRRETELDILCRLIHSLADHEAAMAASRFPGNTTGGADMDGEEDDDGKAQ